MFVWPAITPKNIVRTKVGGQRLISKCSDYILDSTMLLRGNSAVGIPLYYFTVYNGEVLGKNSGVLEKSLLIWWVHSHGALSTTKNRTTRKIWSLSTRKPRYAFDRHCSNHSISRQRKDNDFDPTWNGHRQRAYHGRRPRPAQLLPAVPVHPAQMPHVCSTQLSHRPHTYIIYPTPCASIRGCSATHQWTYTHDNREGSE